MRCRIGKAIISRKWLVVLLIAYLATWIGGWVSHSRELRSRAERYWRDAADRSRDAELEATRQGYRFHPAARPGGPLTYVNWCFPVLPGILVTDSGYVIGRLYGTGGTKVVLFYGFGSVELMSIDIWAS
jgi:hypothetical protein